MIDPIKKFLVAEWRKNITPAQIRRALQRKAPNLRVVENRYNGALQRIQLRINKDVRKAIEPLRKETIRQDAFDPVDALFGDIAKGILEIIESAFTQNVIFQASDATQAVNYRKYDTKLYNQIGINSAAPTELTEEMITNWIRRNTELITNVNAKQLTQLQGLFRDEAFTSIRAKDLNARINKIFKGTRNNVSLIASDQVQKLNGQLDEFKQTSAGIDGYYWSTSLDERVRTSHASRHGQFYRWNAPPPDGHPGQPIRCRCDAEPAVDKLLLSRKELKEEEAKQSEVFAKQRKQGIKLSAEGPIGGRRRKK